MEYKNVLQALHSFCENFQSALVTHSMIGQEPWTTLLEELLGLEELLNDPVVSEPLDNFKIAPISPVEKYGVANSVLALNEDGVSPKEIAVHLKNQNVPLSEKDVKEWLEIYSKTPITTKAEAVFGSVFDTQNQLQFLFENLNNMIEQVKLQTDEHFNAAKITKEQVVLEHFKETRQLIKDASTLMATVSGMQNVATFQKMVIEEVNKVDPATAQRIWKRIKEAKIAFTSLNL